MNRLNALGATAATTLAMFPDSAPVTVPTISFCGMVQWWKWCRPPGRTSKPIIGVPKRP